jgi:hypothetical protein
MQDDWWRQTDLRHRQIPFDVHAKLYEVVPLESVRNVGFPPAAV